MLKEKIRCHSMFKLAHHINGSAWLNLSHHIFSNHLFFPSFFLRYRKCFLYIFDLCLLLQHTRSENWTFLKKQTIGHKRSMEYKVKDQDILLTYERLICRHLAQDKNPRSHSNNGKILECLFALHSSYFFCIFDLIAWKYVIQ